MTPTRGDPTRYLSLTTRANDNSFLAPRNGPPSLRPAFHRQLRVKVGDGFWATIGDDGACRCRLHGMRDWL